MPITLFDAVSDVPSDVPSVTIPLGANIAAGDLRIIRAERSRGNGGLSISPGWTQLYASEADTSGGPYSRWVGIWYRVVQAGDTAPTLTPSTSIANIGWTAITVRGFASQTLTPATSGSSGSSTSVAAPSVATGAGMLLCWFDVTRTDGTANTGSWGTPSGMTARTSSLSPNANGYNVLLATEARTSGNSGTRTATAASAGSWSSSSLFIAESVSTGPVDKTAADTGTRTEIATTSSNTTATDTRQGTDTAVTGSTFTAADSATYAEGVAAGQLTEGPDTGQADEAVTSTGGLAVTDDRQGTDTAGTLGSFTADDTVTHAEASLIGIPVADSGVRTETVTSRGSFTATDPRTGADAATVETLYGDLVISIWAVDPDTGRLTALPDFTRLTMSPERNGPGSISLEYPRDGLNFSVLRDTITADRDLEVEIWNFGNNRGALRGYLQESSGDDIAEDQSAWTFAGGFLELRMAEAIVWPQPIVGEITLGENVDVPRGSVTTAQWDRLVSLGYTATGTGAEEKLSVPQKVLDAVKANATSIPVLADPKRELKFDGVTVGALVNFILTQARSRGALLDIATSFTNGADSNGVTWPTAVTTKYSPGASYESILNSLASQGRVEWSLTWDGTDRTLNCYVPAGRGVDRTVGLRPVVLRAGRNLAEAPRKWSVRSTATAMLGIGAEGFYADASNLDAQTRRGRRIEDSTSSQNLATADAVLSYAQRRLSTKKDGTLEVTHGLAMLPGEPRPLIAFNVGDWVYSQTATTLDRHRVVQWTLTVDATRGGQQASATVTLNDAFLDAVSRQQKELDALTSGETVVGTSEASNKVDTGVPSAPEGLVVGSTALADGQDAYAVVTAGWAAVTTNTDGTAAADIDGYRVEWTRYSAPDAWVSAGTTPTNQIQFTTAVGLPILVRVQTYDRTGNRSEWTELTYPHTTEEDTTPPGVPSTPSGANYLGTVAWTWDGLTADGAEMYAAHPDFAHAQLHMSTTSDFTPDETTRIDTIFGAGTYTYVTTADGSPLVYGTTYFAKLVAVDLRDNASEASGQASAVTGKLVNIDLGPDAVDRANIREAAIGSAEIDILAVNDGHIQSLGVGKLTAGLLEASMIMGSGAIIAGNESSYHVRVDSAGIRLFGANGSTVVSQLLTSNGSAAITGEFRTSLTSGRRIVLNPGGGSPAESRWYPADTNQYARIMPSTSLAIGYIGQGGINMKAHSSRGDQQSGEVNVYPGLASLVWGNEEAGGYITSRIAASDVLAFIGGPRARISADVGQYYGIQLALTRSDGSIQGHSSLILNDQGPSGLARLISDSPNGNSGIQFNDSQSGNHGIAVISGSGGWTDLSCRTLKEFSDRRYKTDIEVDPIDPIAAVRAARPYRYRYLNATPGSKPSLGLMADELPDDLVTGTDQLSVSTYGVTAVLWGAVRQILDRLDELETT